MGREDEDWGISLLREHAGVKDDRSGSEETSYDATAAVRMGPVPATNQPDFVAHPPETNTTTYAGLDAVAHSHNPSKDILASDSSHQDEVLPAGEANEFSSGDMKNARDWVAAKHYHSGGGTTQIEMRLCTPNNRYMVGRATVDDTHGPSFELLSSERQYYYRSAATYGASAGPAGAALWSLPKR